MDTRLSASWSEIDAIKLYGIKPKPGIPEALIADYLELFKQANKSEPALTLADILLRWDLLIEKNSPPIINQDDDESGISLDFYLHSIIIKHRCPALYEKVSNGKIILNGICCSKLVANAFLEYLYCEQLGASFFSGKTKKQLEFYVSEMKQVAQFFKIERLESMCTDQLPFFLGHPNITELYKPICCLIPSSFSKDMMQALENSVDADVEFTFEQEKPLKAHSIIVTTRCPFFKTLLTRWISQDEDKKLVAIEGIDRNSFVSLLEYLYTGKTNVNDSNAVALFIAAHQYLLDDQFTAPLEHIQKSISNENIFDLLYLSNMYSNDLLLDSCTLYMLKNWKQLENIMHKVWSSHKDSFQDEGEEIADIKAVMNEKLKEKIVKRNPHISVLLGMSSEKKETFMNAVVSASEGYKGWPSENIIGGLKLYPFYAQLRDDL